MQHTFLKTFLALGSFYACLAVAPSAQSASSTGAFGVTLNPGSQPVGAFGANLSPAQQSGGIGINYHGISATPNGANGLTFNGATTSHGVNLLCGNRAATPNGANGVNLSPAPSGSTLGCNVGSSGAHNLMY